MKWNRVPISALALAAMFILLGAGADHSPVREQETSPSERADIRALAHTTQHPGGTPAPLVADDPGSDRSSLTQAPLYFLNWWSVNGGGATKVTGVNFQMGMSAGQAAAGFASGAQFKLGVGFWYGVAGAGSAPCPIAMTGDVNVTGNITSADIINLVNFVFKGGAPPLPCEAAGDVNCTGSITSADIINLVNFVFKGGAPPCDVCTLIPSTWSCP